MTATRHSKHVRFAVLASIVDIIALLAIPVVEWFDDHVAEPVATWWNDSTGWEKAAVAVRSSFLLGCLIGVVIALAACRPNEEIPGHGVEPSAVRIAQDDLGLDAQQMAELLQVRPEALAYLTTQHSGR